LKLGRKEQGEADLLRAIELARSIGSKPFELRAATSLARLWTAEGKRDKAHALLAPLYAWFTDGFETRDLIEARAALEALASRESPD
jgi:predicted ATPase